MSKTKEIGSGEREVINPIPVPLPVILGPHVWNSLNYHLRPGDEEKNNQPSMAVPEMGLSLREIVGRYTRGGDIIQNSDEWLGLDDDDEDFDSIYPDPRTLDLEERQLLALSLQDELKQVQERLAEY